MLITVIVKPGRKNLKIEWLNPKLSVSLTAQPKDGKANKQLIKILAEFFGVSKTAVKIKSGQTSHIKRVTITGKESDIAKKLTEIRKPEQILFL